MKMMLKVQRERAKLSRQQIILLGVIPHIIIFTLLCIPSSCSTFFFEYLLVVLIQKFTNFKTQYKFCHINTQKY